MANTQKSNNSKLALVVHPDVGVLSTFQGLLTKNDFLAIVARDLATALLAVSQHYFDLIVVSSHLGEGGDGWPLVGVLRMLFPKAFIAVTVPQTDVLTLKSAINNGANEIFPANGLPEETVTSILALVSGKQAGGERP